MFPEIHLWCYTCWPLHSHLCSIMIIGAVSHKQLIFHPTEDLNWLASDSKIWCSRECRSKSWVGMSLNHMGSQSVPILSCCELTLKNDTIRVAIHTASRRSTSTLSCFLWSIVISKAACLARLTQLLNQHKLITRWNKCNFPQTDKDMGEAQSVQSPPFKFPDNIKVSITIIRRVLSRAKRCILSLITTFMTFTV